MKCSLIRYPTEEDWKGCKQRALITMYGKGLALPKKEPSSTWKSHILEARHSPIRSLWYSFLIEDVPSNISVHICRHVHLQPYVSSLRNDRQDVMDGDEAPRNTPVNMIVDVNAEELMVLANKRLCTKAAPETRRLVGMMRDLAEEATPELRGLLVPMCEYQGGVCHEMQTCGRTAKVNGGWMPAENKPPKPGKYRVFTTDGTFTYCFYDGQRIGEWYMYNDGVLLDCDAVVIAWRPAED